jgi:curved DNA-binding protein CbpA
MSSAAFDPYAVLGVGRNASPTEIRAAYLDLVARYHPDKHGGNPLEGLAAEKMAEINRAHEILSDPQRRAAYDRGGGDFRGAGGGPPWPRPGLARNSRAVKIIALLMALPLLLRFGRGLFRLLAVGFRAAYESLQGLRGTPAALAGILAMVVLVTALLVRRRRLKKRGS